MVEHPYIQLSFNKDQVGRVGEPRIRLLEAVADKGSISAAARATGVTYKAAWDGIYALNNLFDQPLVTTQSGGKKGGGALITEEGKQVIEAFHIIQQETAHFLSALERRLADSQSITLPQVMRSFVMKTSARNALRGTITAIKPGAVNTEVTIQLTAESQLSAIITQQSVDDLQLSVGTEVIALIKSSFVLLAPADETGKLSASNQLTGDVIRLQKGAVNSEYTIDIGDGKTITAIISCEGERELGLAIGDPACAIINASHIILAVDS